MTKAEMRRVALSAVRSELRNQHQNPVLVSSLEAHRTLDDISRKEPKLVASLWYSFATHNQLELFYREWRIWQREQINL